MTANGLLPTDIDHCIAISQGLQRDEQVAPRVSVIIPVFNRDELIAACVRSVQAQTLTDLEIIVVDDASTDRTAQVVAALAARDPRIRLERCERNMGPGMARNGGSRHRMAHGSRCWTPTTSITPIACDVCLRPRRRLKADMVPTTTGSAMAIPGRTLNLCCGLPSFPKRQ